MRGPATALSLALLAGCVTAPQREAPAMPWPERRAQLQQLERFALRGRVAVASAGEGFNASLRWRQSGAQGELALDGPFGVGGLELSSDGESLRLRDARGQELDGEAARAELERRLGFALPLASLRYWVLGVPDPHLPAEEMLDAEQRLVRLEQGGWTIDFERYDSALATPGGATLPRRLTATRPGARVRLVVDRWDS